MIPDNAVGEYEVGSTSIFIVLHSGIAMVAGDSTVDELRAGGATGRVCIVIEPVVIVVVGDDAVDECRAGSGGISICFVVYTTEVFFDDAIDECGAGGQTGI